MYQPGTQQEASFVTPAFELKGRPRPTWKSPPRPNLYNNWAYFNFALINEETGQAYDFGREVSYYTGRDSDGTWTEGSTSDRVIVPIVPPGRYYLRVEPEMAKDAQSVGYTIRVRRDVPTSAWFWIVAALLAGSAGLRPVQAVHFRKHALARKRLRAEQVEISECGIPCT